MRPAGSATRRMMLSAETDLPQPDSPTSATVSPSATSQDTPSTARTCPAAVANVVLRLRTSSKVATVLGYRFCRVQGVDLGRGKAEFRKHLAGVLAESRRRPCHLARRAGKLDRQSERTRSAGARMLELNHHLARQRLRVGGHVGDRVDRAARNTGDVERLDQLTFSPTRNPCTQRFCEGVEILHAFGVACEARVF